LFTVVTKILVLSEVYVVAEVGLLLLKGSWGMRLHYWGVWDILYIKMERGERWENGRTWDIVFGGKGFFMMTKWGNLLVIYCYMVSWCSIILFVDRLSLIYLSLFEMKFCYNFYGTHWAIMFGNKWKLIDDDGCYLFISNVCL
jgi:hypothetical protein